MDRFEILKLESNPHRARYILDALSKTRNCFATSQYSGHEHNLILWGIGGKKQQEAYHKHRARGGNVIMLDIGYFSRDRSHTGSYVRFSFNDYHPQKYLKHADGSGRRFAAHKIQLLNCCKDDGHILLCGIGKKSRVMLGFNGAEWENKKAKEIRAAYPDRKIIYRPKPRLVESITGCAKGYEGQIQDYMRGCSMVVTGHSNVAVDACIHGVPAVCNDGAAAYLYGNDLASPNNPDYGKRLDFLERLAWFNWHARESAQMLEFITHIIAGEKNA